MSKPALQETDYMSLQQNRAYDKKIGYSDAVSDMMQLLQGLDNEQASTLQLKMIEKMGKYQQPKNLNLYDKL